MKIGLVSDTHGLYDPQLDEVLEGADLIIHAGDVEDPAILRRLGAIAPVTAVQGNVDRHLDLPERAWVEAEGLRILVQHIIGRPADFASEASRAGADVVVSGHSHKVHDETHAGIRFLNPGPAGPKRFSLGRSIGILHLEGQEQRFELIELT